MSHFNKKILNNKTVLITGGTGFLGKHIINALKQANYNEIYYVPNSKELNLIDKPKARKAVKSKTVKKAAKKPSR